MSCNSLGFFLILSLTVPIYRLMPQKRRYIILLLASLAFYLAIGLCSLVFVVLLAAVGYFSARAGRARLGIILIALLWIMQRLFGNNMGSFEAIGLSFYALRVISYLVETRRGEVTAERNFFRFLLFVSYFSMALLGPLARWNETSDSLFEGRLAGARESLAGVIRMLWGLFKKTVIADALALPLALIAQDGYKGSYVLLLLILYSAQIYADFSGGTDISLGASRLFGIRLPENFDRPFSSLTLREFWNRWHITLGEWFERYVFYPISLSRPMQALSRKLRAHLSRSAGRKLPVYIATLATWFLTGLWHGARANYIVWGLLNGVLVIMSSECATVVEHGTARHPRLFGSRTAVLLMRVYVFLVIGAVRLLDVYGKVGVTFKRLGSIFSEPSSYGSVLGGFFEIMSPLRFFAVLGALFVVFLVSAGGIRSENVAKKPFLSAAVVFSLIFCVLVFGVYGREFDGGEFIYSKF